MSYSVCSELYSICLLTEYLSNGCLVSYLGSPGMGAFLPFTFLEVCWLSVLWSGTLIPEPGAHKGRQHSVRGCVSVSSALKQSTSECRIPCTGREPQEWWGQCWLHVPLVLPPELLCAKPAGCVCVFSTPQCCLGRLPAKAVPWWLIARGRTGQCQVMPLPSEHNFPAWNDSSP